MRRCRQFMHAERLHHAGALLRRRCIASEVRCRDSAVMVVASSRLAALPARSFTFKKLAFYKLQKVRASLRFYTAGKRRRALSTDDSCREHLADNARCSNMYQ
jgi:hypothetical protein